jgi:hypothetical protein
MDAKTFSDQFKNLMTRALSENPVPLAQIIFELETTKAKCIGIWMGIQAQNEAKELTTKIIPVNGNIPVRN